MYAAPDSITLYQVEGVGPKSKIVRQHTKYYYDSFPDDPFDLGLPGGVRNRIERLMDTRQKKDMSVGKLLDEVVKVQEQK